MIFLGAPNDPYIGFGEIFLLFFITLGPINFVKLFAQLTHDADQKFRAQLATRAIVIATVALLLAAFVGTALLEKWRVSIAAVAMAGGLILFVVAMKTILALYDETAGASRPREAPTLAAAASPLAFPNIVTPYGTAALIVIMTLAPQAKWIIIGLLLVVLLIDLMTMLFVRPLLRVLGLPLQLLGIVLSVLQVALSIQIVFFAIRSIIANGI